MLNNHDDLESFYVFRTLHSDDESWGAVLGVCSVDKLPNICFGMMVYASSKRDAITRGRYLYEKLHKHDSDKNNVRTFAAAAIGPTITSYFKNNSDESIKENLDVVGQTAVEIAIITNKKYKKYFKDLELDDENT